METICSLADYIVFQARVTEVFELCPKVDNLLLLRVSRNGQITKCWIYLRYFKII